MTHQKTDRPKLRIHDWDEWQSYRSDRGQPPWIKVHRDLLRNPKWVELTDAERGQLVSIWLLAADDEGSIPANPKLVEKLCYMDATPDLESLVRRGFLEADDTVTSPRRQDDDNVTDQSALARGRGRVEAEVVQSTSSSYRARLIEEGVRPEAVEAAREMDGFNEVGVAGQFGPNGTLAHIWKGTDPDTRPEILSTALLRMTEKRGSWHSRYFQRILEGAIKDYASNGSNGASAPHMTEDEKQEWYRRRDELEDQGVDPEEAAERVLSDIRPDLVGVL